MKKNKIFGIFTLSGASIGLWLFLTAFYNLDFVYALIFLILTFILVAFGISFIMLGDENGERKDSLVNNIQTG